MWLNPFLEGIYRTVSQSVLLILNEHEVLLILLSSVESTAAPSVAPDTSSHSIHSR